MATTVRHENSTINVSPRDSLPCAGRSAMALAATDIAAAMTPMGRTCLRTSPARSAANQGTEIATIFANAAAAINRPPDSRGLAWKARLSRAGWSAGVIPGCPAWRRNSTVPLKDE